MTRSLFQNHATSRLSSIQAGVSPWYRTSGSISAPGSGVSLCIWVSEKKRSATFLLRTTADGVSYMGHVGADIVYRLSNLFQCIPDHLQFIDSYKNGLVNSLMVLPLNHWLREGGIGYMQIAVKLPAFL